MMNSNLINNYMWLKATLQSRTQPVQTILRILAGAFGGYGLTYSALAALALLLPWPRVEVVFFSALFPSILWLGALLWAFAAPTAQRAWRDLLGVTTIFGILALAAWVHSRSMS
ncbi:hypothetical protein UFO1_0321 [Pelosinus sp. UFO1]|nr:hypothetical protein UFO1_0321 [Pelosinus sp. UFO1]